MPGPLSFLAKSLRGAAYWIAPNTAVFFLQLPAVTDDRPSESLSILVAPRKRSRTAIRVVSLVWIPGVPSFRPGCAVEVSQARDFGQGSLWTVIVCQVRVSGTDFDGVYRRGTGRRKVAAGIDVGSRLRRNMRRAAREAPPDLPARSCLKPSCGEGSKCRPGGGVGT